MQPIQDSDIVLWNKLKQGNTEALGHQYDRFSRIYYDELIASGDIRLKSADLDGTGVSTVAVGIGRVIYGIAYDAENQKIYWGDRSTDVMMRANFDGSSPEVFYNASGDPRGIVIGKQQ